MAVVVVEQTKNSMCMCVGVNAFVQLCFCALCVYACARESTGRGACSWPAAASIRPRIARWNLRVCSLEEKKEGWAVRKRWNTGNGGRHGAWRTDRVGDSTPSPHLPHTHAGRVGSAALSRPMSQ